MFEYFVARRYLKSRKSLFHSIITIISILGVFIGVAALIIVLSIMNGFQNDLKEKILGINAHIAVLKYFAEPISNYDSLENIVRGVKDVTGVSPFIYTKVMINNENYVDGIVLRGVDSRTLKNVSDIESRLKYGSFDLSDRGLPGIVIGSILADNLRVHTGDEVTVFSTANLTPTPMGYIPEYKKFKVIGIFDAGMYEYDASLAYTSLESAQELVGLKKAVTGIEVRVNNIYKAPRIAKLIEKRLGFPYRTNNWIQMNKSLFAALKLEKIMMFIVLTLIVIVASFNIIGTLILIVSQKTRDIGILKSMGASNKQIMKIFILQGLTIGLLGTSMGVLFGFIISFLLGKYIHIPLPGDVYFISTLPVNMQPGDFVIVGFAAILISFIATLYPAMKASRLDPVRAIRYE